MRSLFNVISCILFCLVMTKTNAETCPKVTDVQSNKMTGWHVYDSDTNERLSDKRTVAFEKAAKEFVLAEWIDKGKLKGSIHCYYRDNDGSNLEAYVAKDKVVLSNADGAWYPVTGSMQCASNADHCNFNPEMIAQLASD